MLIVHDGDERSLRGVRPVGVKGRSYSLVTGHPARSSTTFGHRLALDSYTVRFALYQSAPFFSRVLGASEGASAEMTWS